MHLTAKSDATTLNDTDPLFAEYPKNWASLVDKGYVGAQEVLRTISPRKKPQDRPLEVSDVPFNEFVSSDRVLVEYWFGRNIQLCHQMDRKWRWSSDLYDQVFRMCSAFTNVHIRAYPQRSDDCARYRHSRNKLFSIGEDISFEAFKSR